MYTCSYIFDGVFECLVQVKFGTILLYVLNTIVGQNVIFAVGLYHEEEKQHRHVTQAILKAISSAVMELFIRNTRRLKEANAQKRKSAEERAAAGQSTSQNAKGVHQMQLTTMVDNMIKWLPNDQRTIAANSKLAEMIALDLCGLSEIL